MQANAGNDHKDEQIDRNKLMKLNEIYKTVLSVVRHLKSDLLWFDFYSRDVKCAMCNKLKDDYL